MIEEAKQQVSASIDAARTVLACPGCQQELDRQSDGLICSACHACYPIRDGVHRFAKSDLDQGHAEQATIYDQKEAAGILLKPEAAPRLGRYPDLLLTYREHARQVRAMKLRPGSRVLEVGCSTGTFLRSLQRELPVEVYGLDISPASLARAAQLCAEGTWSHASADALPFSAACFDAVFAFDVLEHVADYERVLLEIARVLRPGGQALFHVPVSDIQGTSDALWKRFRPERHRAEQEGAGHFPGNMHTKREWREACTRAGFSVERCTLFNVMFQNAFDYRIRHRILARAFNGRRVPFGVYHSMVAPLIELVTIVPDRVIGALAGVGASVYLRVLKQ